MFELFAGDGFRCSSALCLLLIVLFEELEEKIKHTVGSIYLSLLSGCEPAVFGHKLHLSNTFLNFSKTYRFALIHVLSEYNKLC